MNTFRGLWRKLGNSKQYREEFVAAHVKRSIPHQARALMKARELSQQQLAERSNLSQGVVSRAVDPNYGNLTLNTIIRIAAGFDVAFIGRFVPFSELARWYSDLPEQTWDIQSFEQEAAAPEQFGEPARIASVIAERLFYRPLDQPRVTTATQLDDFRKDQPSITVGYLFQSLQRPPQNEVSRQSTTPEPLLAWPTATVQSEYRESQALGGII